MRAILLTLVLSCAVNAQEPILFGPYIQHVESAKATVLWVTQGDAVTLSTGNKDTVRNDYRVHTVRFDKLQANTEYAYKLENGAAGKFRTAPAGSADFRFVVYGDTRTQEDEHKKIVEQIRKKSDVRFVLNTGDLVASGGDLEGWKGFFRAAGPLMQETWYVPCLGNHENNAREYFDFFDLPGSEDHYSFNWGNVHFAALNTEPGATPDGLPDSAETDLLESRILWQYLAEQRAWLDKDLAQNYGADFFVVYCHVPMYDTKLSRRENQIEIRTAFADILQKHRVEIMMTGHTHNYQHHIINGMNFVVTGGGGAPLYDIEDQIAPESGDVQLVKQEKTHNFVVVDKAGGRLNLEAFRDDGTSIENFSLESNAGLRLVQQRIDTIGGLPWQQDNQDKAHAGKVEMQLVH